MNTFGRSLLNLPSPFVEAKIFEKNFHVREGTIREKPDYDDAWLFACAAQSGSIFYIGSNIGQSAFLELYSDKVEHLLLVEPTLSSSYNYNRQVNYLLQPRSWEWPESIIQIEQGTPINQQLLDAIGKSPVMELKCLNPSSL